MEEFDPPFCDFEEPEFDPALLSHRRSEITPWPEVDFDTDLVSCAALMGIAAGPRRPEPSLRRQGKVTAERGSFDLRTLRKLYRATAFANCRGALLDTSVDITWAKQGISGDEQVWSHHRTFMDLAVRWLENHGQWAAYVWVLERGQVHGLHTHALFHVPYRLRDEFKAYVRVMLPSLVGGPLVDDESGKTLH